MTFYFFNKRQTKYFFQLSLFFRLKRAMLAPGERPSLENLSLKGESLGNL